MNSFEVLYSFIFMGAEFLEFANKPNMGANKPNMGAHMEKLSSNFLISFSSGFGLPSSAGIMLVVANMRSDPMRLHIIHTVFHGCKLKKRVLSKAS